MGNSVSGKYISNLILYFLLLILLVVAIKTSAQNLHNQPHEQFDVHKETDEHGNILRYDSTYTYSYSGNIDNLMLDTLLRNFNPGFSIDFNNDFFFNQPFTDIEKMLNDFNFYFDPAAMDDIMKRHQEMIEKYYYDDRRQLIPKSSPRDFSPMKKSVPEKKI